MPTELRWDGKYNPDGTKRAPLSVELPFQTVETVNESAQERQRTLDLFDTGRPSEWRNRLIWGDKKYVLPSLLPEFAGKVDLIYIDPPFDTGADFSFSVDVEDEVFTKEPSIIEQKAYRDTWGLGLDSYLQWFYETVVLVRDLLAEDGSLYVHLDWHVGHYAKVILDDVFGFDNFRNEIIWQRTGAHNDANKFGVVHDLVLFYTKSDKWHFEPIFVSHTDEHLKTRFNQMEEGTGRRFFAGPITAPGDGPSRKFRDQLLAPPKGRHWSYSQSSIDELEAQKKIYYSSTGTPYLKQYMDEYVEQGRRIQSIWTDILPSKTGKELVNYPTQKPEALLERIIEASSKEGDLVLDCFCGSGTTSAVAERLGRNWITCDLGRFAIHTARKRLLSISGVKPFVVQNLGKYERQYWQLDEFGPDAAQRLAAYTRFILDLYQAQPLEGYTWLHGLKGGRVVHVGSVDSPVTEADVTSIILEWRKNLGKSGTASNGVDVLGWEFAFELNETARQKAHEANIDLHFLTIPREVLEKKAVVQGDIQFFELAALFVNHQMKGRNLTLELTNFMVPREYIPPEIFEKITKWQSWVDYWAVDFNFRDDTFHNEWQTYRTRKDRTIATSTTHTYAQPGTYQVQVKVIDILGNDTTRTIEVQAI